MRSLVETLDAIKKLVPIEEHRLLSDIASLRSSATTAAPEAQAFWWQEAARVFRHHIPWPQLQPTSSWVHQAAVLFNGKPFTEDEITTAVKQYHRPDRWQPGERQ